MSESVKRIHDKSANPNILRTNKGQNCLNTLKKIRKRRCDLLKFREKQQLYIIQYVFRYSKDVVFKEHDKKKQILLTQDLSFRSVVNLVTLFAVRTTTKKSRSYRTYRL